MVSRARARIAGLVVLALAGCFNPTGTDPTAAGSTGPTDATTTTTATGGGTSTTTATSTTGEPTTDVPLTTIAPTTGTTTASGCGSADECPPATPNCEAGECVGCLGPDDCTAAAPFCDGGVCRGCVFHEECDRACDIAEGKCFPADTLEFTVMPSPACGPCGDGAPCCSIAQALQTAAGKPDRYVRITLESSGIEDDGVVLDQTYPDKVIALVGNGQNPVVAPAAGSAFSLTQVESDRRVYLWRLRFTGGMGSSGATCTGGRLWLDRVVIDTFTTTPGLLATGCSLAVRRSTIINNNGAISITDGALELRDAVVSGSIGAAPELTLGAGSELDARYATVVDPVGGHNGLLVCAGTVPIDLENSIVVSTPELDTAAGCLVAATRSVISPGLGVQRGDNVPAVISDFEFTKDYRLQTIGGPAADAARWRTGYSPTDIDGTARPTVDDSPDYAGAHIPLE